MRLAECQFHIVLVDGQQEEVAGVFHDHHLAWEYFKETVKDEPSTTRVEFRQLRCEAVKQGDRP